MLQAQKGTKISTNPPQTVAKQWGTFYPSLAHYLYLKELGHLQLQAREANIQGDHVGFNTGNGEKLSYSRAEQARSAAWP